MMDVTHDRRKEEKESGRKGGRELVTGEVR